MREVPHFDNLDDFIDTAKRCSGAESDRKLSQLMGLSQNAVNTWRSGKALPSEETMQKLAEIAGVDPCLALTQLAIWRTAKQTPANSYQKILKIVRSHIAASMLAIFVVVFFGVTSPAHAQPQELADSGVIKSANIDSGKCQSGYHKLWEILISSHAS